MSIISRAATAPAHPFMDPLAILLFMVAVLLTWAQVQHRSIAPVVITAGPEARLVELYWALSEFEKTPDISAKPRKNQWNVAVETVLLAEGGHAEEARGQLGHTPEGAFRACWEAAYGSGPMPTDRELAAAYSGLGDGLASKCLEISLAARESEDAGRMRSETLKIYRYRAIALLFTLFALLIGAVIGMGMGIWMLAKRAPMPDSPQFQMSWVSVARVCLGWYIVFLASATITGWVNSAIPLGVWALPAAYSVHAASGVAFICAAEKVSLTTLWRRVSPKNRFWIPNGIQFLLLALALVLALTAILSLFMPEGDPPQRELTEFIRGNNGVLPFLVIFGTVALLGPAFEELFFRGFLLPVMRRSMSAWWALLVSSGLFGAIHFQLQTLPTLALLGGVLGLAFLRTGDIKTAVFVHGCWNGGVFLFQKMLL